MEGPYHCPPCLARFRGEGKRCVTLDTNVMHTVLTGRAPQGVSAAEQARCARCAMWLAWDGSGERLLALGEWGSKTIPPICQRDSLVAEV